MREGKWRLALRTLTFAFGAALAWIGGIVSRDVETVALLLLAGGASMAGLALFRRGPSALNDKLVVGGIGLALVVPAFAAIVVVALQFE